MQRNATSNGVSNPHPLPGRQSPVRTSARDTGALSPPCARCETSTPRNLKSPLPPYRPQACSSRVEGLVLVPHVSVTPEVRIVQESQVSFWCAIEVSGHLSRPAVGHIAVSEDVGVGTIDIGLSPLAVMGDDDANIHVRQIFQVRLSVPASGQVGTHAKQLNTPDYRRAAISNVRRTCF